MFGLGTTELVIILVILLLIFGANRLGDIGSFLGKSIKDFRKSLKEDEIEQAPKREISKQTSETTPDGFSAPKESEDQSTK